MTRATIAALAVTAMLSGCADEPLPPAEVVNAVFAAVAAGDEGAIEELVREDYIQHSALAPDGRAGLLASLETLQSLTIEPHRQIVDGDLVTLHSTYTFPDGSQQVAFDVFRIEEGLLAEHWDAFQPLVPASETVSGRSMVDGPTVPDAAADTAGNRALVTEFVDVILTQGQFDRITDFISTEMYLQHNPLIGDGLEGLGAFTASLDENGLAFFYTSSPLVVAQGDFVMVGSEGRFGPMDDPPYAVFYDLFRVENGRIVEHWDVIPAGPDPDALPHDNGFF
ncbi:MAG: nuclear transport factor 2 family protein [Sandaracinaceae bacterium]